MHVEDEREVEVRPSPIHGRGLFALRPFRAGDTVLRWNLSCILSGAEAAALPASKRVYTHPFEGGRVILIQPPERYVNHSCDSNTFVRDFSDVALRDIAAGEEITSDYSSDGSGSKFACTCGAANCRGALT